MEKNIKDYRDKELKHYVVGNILFIILLIGVFERTYTEVVTEGNFTTLEIVKELLPLGVISSVIYVYVFLMDALVPGNWKDRVCLLWGRKPGETIFSKIGDGRISDIRFTKKQAEHKYENIYSQLDVLQGKNKYITSNSEWYHIYKFWEFEPMIYESNRDYLLCRDLCVATL